MFQYLVIFILIIIVNGSDIPDNSKGGIHPLPAVEQRDYPTNDFEVTTTEPNSNIEDVINIVEKLIVTTEKSYREGIVPIKFIEEVYEQISEKLSEIIDEVSQVDNAHKFLNAKGIERIIIPNISSNNDQMRKQILSLIKTLFEIEPTATKAIMPVSVIDKLLDIFENEDNVDFKAISLDIMYLWLPNNPKLQARVMKLKGLEPFYHQVSKLDVHASHKLMDLFDKILEEHLNARTSVPQTVQTDSESLKLYQVIGLVERMSTPIVCNGFLNIFDILFNNNNDQVSVPVVKLVNKVKHFCLNIYKGKRKAIKMFDNVLSYISKEKTASLLGEIGLNPTEIKKDLIDYAHKLKEYINTEL